MIKNKKSIGNRIKAIRLQVGKNKREFGEIIYNASDSLVNKWEQGSSVPTHKRLLEIAKIGNVSIPFLLYGDVRNFVTEIIEYYFSENKQLSIIDKNEIINVNTEKNNQLNIEIFYETQREFIRLNGEDNINQWELLNESDNRAYNLIESTLIKELEEINNYYRSENPHLFNEINELQLRLKQLNKSNEELKKDISQLLSEILSNETQLSDVTLSNILSELIDFYSNLLLNKFQHYLYVNNQSLIERINSKLLNDTKSYINTIQLTNFKHWNSLKDDSKELIYHESKNYIELLIMRELNKE